MTTTSVPYASLVLILLSCSSLLLPSTTALPLPFARPTAKAYTCLTFQTPLEAANLQLSDGATCALNSYVPYPPEASSQALTRFSSPKQRPILRRTPNDRLLNNSTKLGNPQNGKSLLRVFQNLRRRSKRAKKLSHRRSPSLHSHYQPEKGNYKKGRPPEPIRGNHTSRRRRCKPHALETSRRFLAA